MKRVCQALLTRIHWARSWVERYGPIMIVSSGMSNIVDMMERIGRKEVGKKGSSGRKGNE